MIIPFVVFWLLLILCRDDLGLKGIGVAIAIWVALLTGFVAAGVSPFLFVGAQAMLDIVLILMVFGGDVRIN